MDVDGRNPPHNSPHNHPNAVAGPSSIPDVPPLYLPPPGPPQHPPYFRSTEDLLKRFQLLPAYNKYVRPFAPPVSELGATDKGKGKEIPPRDIPGSSPAAPTPTAGNDGDDDDGGKGEKKFKNYKHLIKSVPGRHSMKKDDFLEALMMVSAKQKAEIRPFSQKVTREAFAVSLEGLKGWNIHTLIPETSQAREDRKKRKELKKLAKAQGQGILPAAAAAGVPNTPTGVPATPGAASTPTSAAPAAVPPRTTTPRPGAPKPSPALQQPPPPRGRTPVGIGTPQSVSTPGPGPAPPAAQGQHAAPTPTGQPPPRGVKREREETGLQVSGNVPPHVQQGAGAGAGAGQDGVKIGKAGVPGVRPRPVKKQRLEANGPAQVPYQQPTPHA